jgi:hypothetical protein
MNNTKLDLQLGKGIRRNISCQLSIEISALTERNPWPPKTSGKPRSETNSLRSAPVATVLILLLVDALLSNGAEFRV